jgi:hypothetical protein
LESKEGVLIVEHKTEEIQKKLYHEIHKVDLDGTIQAPGNYVEKRAEVKEQTPRDLCHLLYSYQKRYIHLVCRENHPLKYTIKGQLVENPYFAELNINKGKRYEVKDLTSLLKKYRFLFSDREENSAIVKNLQEFRLEASKVIEASNNQRGDQKDLYEIKAKSNVDLSFNLLMPVFIGQPKKKFKVEICYDVREKSIEVWFESPELIELLDDDTVKIIDEQLKRFPSEFVQIEQ